MHVLCINYYLLIHKGLKWNYKKDVSSYLGMCASRILSSIMWQIKKRCGLAAMTSSMREALFGEPATPRWLVHGGMVNQTIISMRTVLILAGTANPSSTTTNATVLVYTLSASRMSQENAIMKSCISCKLGNWKK